MRNRTGNLAVYNEIEPYAVSWLRNLSRDGHVARGSVNAKSIRDMSPTDVAGSSQFHAFAGIGVWSHALRLAGWPDDRPVWTGSCPCQPFSTAGKGKGFDDERHLWPEWFRLIRKCRPPIIFGEQVSSPDGLAWFDLVSSDLEGEGYAVGALDTCAAGVGAPHLRQRLYFMAHAKEAGRGARRASEESGRERESGGPCDASVADPSVTRLARRSGERGNARAERETAQRGGDAGMFGVADADKRERRRVTDGKEHYSNGPETGWQQSNHESKSSSAVFWHPVEWLPCRDGKQRPTQPGLQPLAHGVADRVGKLRAYGNAIVAPLAAAFVASAMDALDYEAQRGA